MNPMRLFAAALAAACVSTAAWADIVLAGISEASGAGAAAGTHFRNGYQQAIDEANATGGVLGQALVLRQFSIDSTEAAARKAADDALAAKPFAILGPVFSGLTLAAMERTAPAAIPHFTGGEAVSLTRKFHPSLLRTSLTQQGSVPRLAAFTVYGLGARRLGLLSVENEFGRNGREVLRDTAGRKGAQITFDEHITPGQKDFAPIVQRLLAAPVDALVLMLNEDESLQALKELRRQGFRLPIVGDGPLLSPRVLEDPQAAAEGLIGHTGLSVDLPTPVVTRFVAEYQRRYGTRPDHNALKGYFAVQVLRVGLEAVGRVDAAAFLQHIKNARLDGRAHPTLMASTAVYYDLFGDLSRESYLVQVRNGKLRLLAAMSAVDSPFVGLANGKNLPLNSDEFRRELQGLITQADAGKDAQARQKR